MAKLARENIALLLKGGELPGSFSAETSAPASGIELSVDGVGPVKLPVGAAQERALVSVARPASFGLGEETLTDISVRDTWELSPDQVALGGQWDRVLQSALVEVHEELGLPRGARLRAELHALLVYGPDQFFAPHKDSEKDDEMVATLVVSLPSIHTGGELVISHGGQSRTYRHTDRHTVGFVAFYADCVHEVRPVRSGRRVTLTFNLMVTRGSEGAEPDPEEELASLVGEHFATPVTLRWSTETLPPPNHLVVLLDHEYSERGLAADLLKGRDIEWVGKLRQAAQRASCLSALALAEIRQTSDAYTDHRSSRRWYDDDDWRGDEDDPTSYEVGELLGDETSLGWWKRAGVGRGEKISLGVDESEVCEVTPTAALTPYESEYEGYMGNYGNTLDRWYRRAAVVLWPKARDFIARAEADLPGAVAELEARLNGEGDDERIRTDARALAGLVTAGDSSLFAPLLRVADALDDAELANGLLAGLRGEGLVAEDAVVLAACASRYGGGWIRPLIESWFAVGAYRIGHREWVSDTLPELARALRRADADSILADLVRRLWVNMSIPISSAVSSGPSTRAARMDSLVDQVEALFEVADAELAEEFVAVLAGYDDGVLDLELPLLHRLGAGAPASLVSDSVRRLEVLVDVEPRAADDWSIAWSGCGCDLCDTLGRFLSSATATERDWPLRKDRRQHIHRRIDDAELPVTHRTVRKGSPYTLHLAKQRDLHQREAQRRGRLAADLAWLRGEGRAQGR